MPRAFKNWLQAYVHHTRFSESPDSFHFWTGVATIAGALRRRVWIDQLHFQWTPNFYIVLVGPPGVAAKSTSIRAGLSLLEKVPGVAFGPSSTTWQALTEALQNAQDFVEIEGRPTAEVMSCLTIGVSELGTFLRPDDKEFVDTLVAMWDGQKEVWRRQTKTQGETVIHNPWINLIGCTTPAWLKDNFPDVLIGGGLTSRMVFVFADKKRQFVAYPSRLVTPATFKEEEEYLVHDLLQIAQLKGEFTISEAALEWGDEWYRAHWMASRSSHLASEKFAGWWARKQTHLHKLAMVLSAAKRDDLRIEKEDLEEALTLVTDLETDMQHVFSSIGVSHSAKVSNEVLTFIRNHKQIKLQDLWKLCFNTTAQKDFSEAIVAARDAGFIKIVGKGETQMIVYTGSALAGNPLSTATQPLQYQGKASQSSDKGE